LLGRRGVHAAERRIEVPHDVGERQLERRPAANQHVIVAGAKRATLGKPHDLAQAPPHAIALDRIADLPGYCETNPHRALVAAQACLQDESLGRRPYTLGGSPKVRPAFQALHGADFSVDLGSAFCRTGKPASR
jgi:hypothetical protein